MKRPKRTNPNEAPPAAGLTDLYLPCHEIAAYLMEHYSPSTPGTILTAYALTGCDTVSYPFGCGKKRAFMVTLDCLAELAPLGSLEKPLISLQR